MVNKDFHYIRTQAAQLGKKSYKIKQNVRIVHYINDWP